MNVTKMEVKIDDGDIIFNACMEFKDKFNEMYIYPKIQISLENKRELSTFTDQKISICNVRKSGFADIAVKMYLDILLKDIKIVCPIKNGSVTNLKDIRFSTKYFPPFMMTKRRFVISVRLLVKGKSKKLLEEIYNSKFTADIVD